MTDNIISHESIKEFIELYIAGDYGDIRIKAEGLLKPELRNLVNKALEDVKAPDHKHQKGEMWEKCADKWCKSPVEGSLCRYRIDPAFYIDELFNHLKGEYFFEKTMVVFWYIHSAAYERWEDSFDYDSIGCILHLGRQVAEVAHDDYNFSDGQKAIFKAMRDLSIQIHHAAYIENSMICNDPVAFAFHAEKHAFYSEKMINDLTAFFKGMGQGEETYGELMDFVNLFIKYLKPVEEQHKALSVVGDLMKIRREDPSTFIKLWNEKKEYLSSNCLQLEEAGNFESASEIRAHYLCLQAHAAEIGNRPALQLNEIEGKFMFGFYHELESDIISSKNGHSFFQEIGNHFENHKKDFTKCITIVNITEDPPPDILESSLGKENFENLCLVFQDIEVRELGSDSNEQGRSIATLTPKLYHFSLGIGMVSFEFKIPNANVSEFYALKHMASPHSGQYEFFNVTKDESGTTRVESRLNEIASEIISKYFELFPKSRKHTKHKIADDVTTWKEVEQTWFSHFEIYRITDSSGVAFDYKDLKKHFEWPGIISYPRADRSSLDDWIRINVKSLELKNMAEIRAHKGDIFFMSENHSICYLPDDPKFIVYQYGETVRWVFLIRALMLYCMNQSHEVSTTLKKDIRHLNTLLTTNDAEFGKDELKDRADELIEKRTKIQLHRTMVIGILEHANAVRASQYADHGLLLKHAFQETGILEMIRHLQDSIDGLSSIQEGFTIIMDTIVEKNRKKTQERMNLLLLIVALITIIPSYDIIVKIWEEHTFHPRESPEPVPWYVFLLFSIIFLFIVVKISDEILAFSNKVIDYFSTHFKRKKNTRKD